jgi:hypothetical protein
MAFSQLDDAIASKAALASAGVIAATVCALLGFEVGVAVALHPLKAMVEMRARLSANDFMRLAYATDERNQATDPSCICSVVCVMLHQELLFEACFEFKQHKKRNTDNDVHERLRLHNRNDSKQEHCEINRVTHNRIEPVGF